MRYREIDNLLDQHVDPQTREAVQRLINVILIGKHYARGWMKYPLKGVSPGSSAHIVRPRASISPHGSYTKTFYLQKDPESQLLSW